MVQGLLSRVTAIRGEMDDYILYVGALEYGVLPTAARCSILHEKAAMTWRAGQHRILRLMRRCACSCRNSRLVKGPGRVLGPKD